MLLAPRVGAQGNSDAVHAVKDLAGRPNDEFSDARSQFHRCDTVDLPAAVRVRRRGTEAVDKGPEGAGGPCDCPCGESSGGRHTHPHAKLSPCHAPATHAPTTRTHHTSTLVPNLQPQDEVEQKIKGNLEKAEARAAAHGARHRHLLQTAVIPTRIDVWVHVIHAGEARARMLHACAPYRCAVV